MPRALILLGLVAIACAPKTDVSQPKSPIDDASPQGPFTLEGLVAGALLLPDLGGYTRDVTVSAPAKAWFDQGLALTYGFNHDEAARSFAKAAAIDPDCAMCFWGVAYALGPNYNMPLLEDRAAGAHAAIVRAQEIASKSAPVEQALIAALAKRYKGPEWIDPAAQQPFNEAYAKAMKTVASRFGDDIDVQVLYAEALMNANPWKLWSPTGEPAPGTEELVRALETALQRNPDHPGANHYYIHAVEASKAPDRAVPSAERLPGLIPGAGHVVHMPAHIFQRVGRYADASAANRNAVEADMQYLARTKPPGYYAFYLSHNFGFLAYSASMEGRFEESLAAARRSADSIPRAMVCGMPGMDFFATEPLLVLVRFGRWTELLAEPKPDAKYQVHTALWLHAHGMALASTDALPDARKDLAELQSIVAALPEDLQTGLNQGKLVLELATKILEARIAEREKSENAIALWTDAVSIEDRLAYNEPADWFYPTRHFLGAALLDANRPKDARAVYEEDLRRNPQNGWALVGLWQSLRDLKDAKRAASVKAEFEMAWARADIELARSAF